MLASKKEIIVLKELSSQLRGSHVFVFALRVHFSPEEARRKVRVWWTCPMHADKLNVSRNSATSSAISTHFHNLYNFSRPHFGTSWIRRWLLSHYSSRDSPPLLLQTMSRTSPPTVSESTTSYLLLLGPSTFWKVNRELVRLGKCPLFGAFHHVGICR